MVLTQKSDILGAAASGLCLIHCIATPLLFVAQTCTGDCHDAAPAWWRATDILFIALSFLAIFWSVKNTSKNWMKYAMWASWGVLSLIILNEKIEWVHLPHETIYFPALSLVFLHLYNRRYCQCDDDQC